MCPQISLIYSLTHNLYFIFITHVYPSFVISLDPSRKYSMGAARQEFSSRHIFQFSVFLNMSAASPEFSQNFLRGFCVKKERAGKEKNRGEE